MNWDEIGFDIGGQFDKLGRERYNQEAANRAEAEMMAQILNSIPDPELPPGIEMNPYAQQQRSVGQAGIQAVLNSPDLGRLPSSQVGQVMNPLLKMGTQPMDYAGKKWEERQKSRADITDRAREQRITNTLKEQERETFIKAVDAAVRDKRLTPEQGQEAIAIKYGLAPRAKAPPSSIAEYEAYKNMPPEERQGFDTYRNARQQFIVDNRRDPQAQPPSSFKEYDRAKSDPAYAEFLGKFRGDKGAPKPVTPGQEIQVKNYTKTRLNDPNSYYLSTDEFESAVKSKLIPTGAQLKPEILEDVNQTRATVGLPPLTPSTRKGTEQTTFMGIPVTGKNPGQKDYYSYAPEQGQAATPRTQQDAPQQQAMPTMPPPQQAAGRTIRDTVSGKRYKSNGKQWMEIK